ncbi:MAG: hypothetical protein JST22_20375 [Bacteroidetes bacterium]|nr:hypothetical protein [Bacteroidota bacterium]
MLSVALTLAACGDRKEPASGDGKAPAAQPPAAAPAFKPAPAPDAGGQSGAMPHSGIDSTDGTLTVVGSGLIKNTWKFADVTAYVEEHANAGETRSVLTLEAHDGGRNMHFRLRLVRTGGAVNAGTYAIESTGESGVRRLEARWEQGDRMFNSAIRGRGSVQLKEIDATHIDGSFNISLGSVGPDSTLQTLTGTFNQKLVH